MKVNKKSHGLGKGMSSLLSNFDYDISNDNQVTPVIEKIIAPVIDKEKKEAGEKVLEVSIDDIVPQINQPRKSFDEDSLKELADSIKNQGVLQPLLVEEYAPGKYSIIAGERRYRAAKIAGLEKVPVLVRSLSELQRIEVALIENIQREDLNAIDEASAYYYLIQKSGLTQDEVANKVGKKRSTITNSLRLLQLPDSMKDDIVSGVLTPGHARAILSLTNPSDRVILRNKIVEKELSVRAAEKEAEALNMGKKLIIKKKEGEKNQYVQEVEDKFLNAFGTKVAVKGNLKRGKLVIPYDSRAELERIYQLLDHNGNLFEE